MLRRLRRSARELHAARYAVCAVCAHALSAAEARFQQRYVTRRRERRRHVTYELRDAPVWHTRYGTRLMLLTLLPSLAICQSRFAGSVMMQIQRCFFFHDVVFRCCLMLSHCYMLPITPPMLLPAVALLILITLLVIFIEETYADFDHVI